MGKTREKLDASLTPVPTHVNNHQSERQTHCLIRKVLAFFFVSFDIYLFCIYVCIRMWKSENSFAGLVSAHPGDPGLAVSLGSKCLYP